MYGGYGSIWNQQGSSQWQAGNTQSQNQQHNVTQSQQFQLQQQPMMTYTGNVTNVLENNTAGMMGYMNMGMPGIPYMHYGGNAGFVQNPNSTWLTNQSLTAQQQGYHQSPNQGMVGGFPGGRPPLPPGPPPPDKPSNLNQLGNMQSLMNNQKCQAPPPLPPATPGIHHQRPPPPPPPSYQPSQVTAKAPGIVANTISSTAKNLKPEDAYDIIRKAAALGMLPNNGPLAPLTALNVSEELFGSKSNNEGIPGLDMVDDHEFASSSPQPEVIDLEKDADSKGKNAKLDSGSGSDRLHVLDKVQNIPTDTSSTKSAHLKDGATWVTASQDSADTVRNEKNKTMNPNQKKELVWELRPDVKANIWKTGDGIKEIQVSNDKSSLPNQSNMWEISEHEKVDVFQNTCESKILDSDSGISSYEDKPHTEVSSNKNDESNENSKSVKIPLEPADGKDLVYDKKTLKQFDKKFREWETQFENWKRDNEHHPDRCAYKQFLNQWNAWREQLVEQRRSILDKMTKARLDSKEILMAKFESLESEEKSLESTFDAVGKPSELNPSIDSAASKRVDSGSLKINPFEAVLNASEAPRKLAPAAPVISKFNDGYSNSNSGIPPLIPGLIASDKKGLLPIPTPNNEKSDRPVERILRDSGRRSDTNIFDADYSQRRQDTNPFSMEENDHIDSKGDTCHAENSERLKKFDSKNDSGSSPFKWSLSSQNERTKNPFDSPNASSNPFMQPCGPNPFEIKSEARLPSLLDFIQRTSDSMVFPTSTSSTLQSLNPFGINTSDRQTSALRTDQVERIPRDPQGNQNSEVTQSSKTLRLEANPIGMPLLIAAKEASPPPKSEMDEISHLFSRDRGPAEDSNDASNVQMNEDDYFDEEAEVIDYGASNSMDDMDFPRGENPENNKEDENDADFSLEDSEVIDYSQAQPLRPEGQFPGPGPYHENSMIGYQGEYDQGYPPYPVSVHRGRGRGYGTGPWGRGHPRGGFPPGSIPPYGRGFPPTVDPNFQEFSHGPSREGLYNRGYMHMGRGGTPLPEAHGQWYQHDDRAGPMQTPMQNPPIREMVPDPEIVELSPSPEPNSSLPSIKIAPPNPEFERERRRSRSRDRYSRGKESERSRSRSRERIARRGREDNSLDKRDRRRDESPYNVRRDRERDRRPSPDRRGRNDDYKRDRERERDRHYRDRRGRSRSRSNSKSPAGERQVLYRNPLFPSASSGMLGSHPASNPPPPRYQTVLIEDILNTPGRLKRPSRLVIIMRGLPGSGKSHIVKLIKEREVMMGGKAPRILSLDNYFMTEMEKKEKDPVTGLDFKKTVMEYEYDEERDPEYRAQLMKQFKKTLDEGYFSFVIVDCVNEFVKQFEEMATLATQKRFQVYVAEIDEAVEVCTKRNVHKRTKDQISKINRNWERTPSNLIKLDTRTLLQDEAVQDVEMEDVSDVEPDNITEKHGLTPAERGKIGPQVVNLDEIEDDDSGDHLLVSAVTSKWDSLEHTQEKLNKLDGLMKRRRTTNDEVESAPSIETWLSGNIPEEEDYVRRQQTTPGQKRVRWADIEERREQEKMRELGFVVGHTDWKRMMDPTFGSSALTKTKFI